jgi:hypothetical protein
MTEEKEFKAEKAPSAITDRGWWDNLTQLQLRETAQALHTK